MNENKKTLSAGDFVAIIFLIWYLILNCIEWLFILLIRHLTDNELILELKNSSSIQRKVIIKVLNELDNRE